MVPKVVPPLPSIRRARTLRRDDGVSALFVALSLFLIMGMGALAIDVGNVYQVRRLAQNAADHIALTAAYVECSGGTEAEAIEAGERAATSNGISDLSNVTITRLGDGEYEAQVSADVDGSVSRVLGATQLGTSGAAVVSCQSGGGSGTTLHAHATGCSGYELLITGDGDDGVTVNGGTHSNGDLRLTGERLELYDGTTLGGSYTAPADDEFVEGGAQPGSTSAPWPYEWNIADYAPGGSIASAAGSYYYSYTGNRTLKEVNAGIHYVAGNLTISAEDDEFIVNPVGGESGATFVATGTIRVIADVVNITAYSSDSPGGAANNGLQLFSNWDPADGACGADVAVQSDGESGITYEGVIFAPHGKVILAGNSSQSVAVWSNFIELSGDGLTLYFPGNVTLGDPQLEFQQ